MEEVEVEVVPVEKVAIQIEVEVKEVVEDKVIEVEAPNTEATTVFWPASEAQGAAKPPIPDSCLLLLLLGGPLATLTPSLVMVHYTDEEKSPRVGLFLIFPFFLIKQIFLHNFACFWTFMHVFGLCLDIFCMFF